MVEKTIQTRLTTLISPQAKKTSTAPSAQFLNRRVSLQFSQSQSQKKNKNLKQKKIILLLKPELLLKGTCVVVTTFLKPSKKLNRSWRQKLFLTILLTFSFLLLDQTLTSSEKYNGEKIKKNRRKNFKKFQKIFISNLFNSYQIF